MLTIPELNIIKEYNKGHKIIYLYFGGREFVFRTLGIKEYENILTCFSDEKDIEDAICQATLIYPEEYEIEKCEFAGLPEVAAEQIKYESGFETLDPILDRMHQQREEMNLFHNQCRNLIKAAFPEYRYEEIEEWGWIRLIDYAVKAEAILKMRKSSESVELVDNRGKVENDDNEEISIKELSEELIKNGVDPMMYFGNKYENPRKELIQYPLIGGYYWNKEGVLNAIRQQK